MQQKRFLRRPQVVEMTGLSASTIFNMEKAGTFPMHFLITPRCAGWDEEEVVHWMNGRRAVKHVALPVPDAKSYAHRRTPASRAAVSDLL